MQQRKIAPMLRSMITGRQSEGTRTLRPNSKFGGILFLLLIVSVPLAGSLFIRGGNDLGAHTHVSLPLHAALEAQGGLACLGLALLLYFIGADKGREPIEAHAVVIGSLIFGGLLDCFHAIQPPGNTFVWLRTCSTFGGGLILAALWIPNSGARRKAWIFFSIGAALLVSIYSTGYPGGLPDMLRNGSFAPTAMALNLVGGLGYLAGATRILVRTRSDTRKPMLLIATFCLFGTAGLLFCSSSLWDTDWWWWHFVRYIASLILLAQFSMHVRQLHELVLHDRSQLHERSVQAEKEIARAAALSDQALDLTKSGYWCVPLDDSGFYTSSERAAAIFGDEPNPEWRYSLAYWRSCLDAADSDIGTATGQAFAKAISGETPYYDAVYPYRRPSDGRVVWLHNLGVIVHDLDRPCPEMRGVVQDVTAVMEAQLELDSARKTAEHANRLKSEFLANMSHEIRTPMNAILGFAEIMKRDPSLPSEQLTRVETIDRAGAHLLALINDILEMSKIEAGKVTINECAFDLYMLLDDLLAIYHVRAEAKGLLLTLHRASNLPRHIVSDEGKLRQTLTNLIGNAVKFTNEGRITVSATTSTEGASTLQFTVSDTGPGIAEEEIGRLFNPFVQTSVGTSAGGTGLGLSISRKYARILGGDIIARSKLGNGATFVLTIQAKLSEIDEVIATNAIPRILRLADGQDAPRILIVDDQPVNRELLIAILNPAGFETAVAENGLKAVELTQHWKPEIILMDMRMPVMDGFEAIRRIRSDAEGASILIVGLTASAFEEQKAAVLACGADLFMRKPFKQDELLAAIGKEQGLSYVYSGTTTSPALSIDYSGIPESLRAEAMQACEEAAFDQLQDICTKIAACGDTAAANGLRAHLTSFDYVSIKRHLRKVIPS